MAESQEVFAFGENDIQGISCPVRAAGERPQSYPYSHIAEEYDNQVFKRNPEMTEWCGVISNDEAEQCFKQAIEALRERGELDKAEFARQVWANVFK